MFWIILILVRKTEINQQQNRNYVTPEAVREILQRLRGSFLQSQFEIVNYCLGVTNRIASFQSVAKYAKLKRWIRVKPCTFTELTLWFKQDFFYRFCWKLKYDAKSVWCVGQSGWWMGQSGCWVGQDLNVHVTLTVGRIDIWLTPYLLYNEFFPNHPRVHVNRFT